MNRSQRLIREAIDGLTEFYPCLNDETLAQELASGLQAPDTGNTQNDYQSIRDQLEQRLRRYEQRDRPLASN
jgi:hypothetical protein